MDKQKKWETEPNELSWIDEKTALECYIKRHSSCGHLCGYVRIPPNTPLYEISYNEKCPESLKSAMEKVKEGTIGKRSPIQLFIAVGKDCDAGFLFDVHGGITFSGKAYWKEYDLGFWYGFDCGHCDDLSPYYQSTMDGEYRDMEYVKSECANLARQINEVLGL